MKSLPKIVEKRTVAQSRLFRIEEVSLQFSNGVESHYERIAGSPQGAVLIIPMPNPNQVWMIREYAVGVERYELTLPKGRIEPGESMLEAANRELQEEIGLAARSLTHLQSLTLAPGYISHTTHIVLAEDLYPSKSDSGDEPEDLEKELWDLQRLPELLQLPECSEARTIAALYMARERLNG